uniref:Uncharacterized protein n=1 Tax=Panagrolaimus sp. ES5 TaxID=591445 RepID=A0AC34GHA0_9BILA
MDSYGFESSSSSSDGLQNSNHENNQIDLSNGSFESPNLWANANIWNTTISPINGTDFIPSPVARLPEKFNWFNLVNKAHCEVQKDIQQGISFYKFSTF